jgi:hypothetical protein
MRERQQEGQRPASGHLAEMVMPEKRRGQRHHRNRQQQAGKGHRPQRGQLAAVQFGGRGQAWPQTRKHQRQHPTIPFHVVSPDLVLARLAGQAPHALSLISNTCRR